MKKVLFITHDNQYLCKTYFAKGLASALKRKGIECPTFEPEKGQLHLSDLQAIRRFAPDLTCCFNTILPFPNGEYLWDLLETPHLFLNLDSALYSLQHRKSPYITITCVDRFDLPLMRTPDFPRTFFFPHACDPSLSYDPQAPRPYDIVLIGSCYDHEALRAQWRERLDESQRRVVEGAIDLALADHTLHFMEAVARAVAGEKLNPHELDFVGLCLFVDYYLRGRDRWEMVRACGDREIHIFGEIHAQTSQGSRGWSGLIAQHPNVVLHPPCEYEEGLAILAQSKICLNSVPTFKEGAHERLFHGLMLGAFPISTGNAFLQSEFPFLPTYRRGAWQEIGDLLQHLLDDEAARHRLVEQGRAHTLAHHTWDQRAELILRSNFLISESIPTETEDWG